MKIEELKQGAQYPRDTGEKIHAVAYETETMIVISWGKE
jgi:hypothetical protein